ncbi:MAG: GC-type dockerin domain-anchored protein [Phycisphaerales bacterium]
MRTILPLTVLCVSGLAAGAAEPIALETTPSQIRDAGHLYFNIATGEQIFTPVSVGDAQQGASGTEGTEIWIVGAGGCEDPGPTTSSSFYALDRTSGTSSGDWSPALLDWGDIASDTVVDCVQVHWITDHADTDTNSDGNPDGVEGFGATWTFWDGMNGRSPQLESIATPIIDFTFFNLPGEYPPDSATVAFYTAVIDLAGSFGDSLVFEIGDTDSDLQGASLHNARMDLRDNDLDSIPDIDPDGDGFADWGWSIDFFQPGTVDFDNADGDSDPSTGLDGDIAALAVAGLSPGYPEPGIAVFDDVAEEWSWVTTGPTAGSNEDLFGLITFSGYEGPFWFGGFNCDPVVPLADFLITLYGPLCSGCGSCPADLAGNFDGSPDGQLNFSDISAFLSLYSAGILRVDFAGNVDGTPDGILNFSDVSAYLGLFSQGCP